MTTKFKISVEKIVTETRVLPGDYVKLGDGEKDYGYAPAREKEVTIKEEVFMQVAEGQLDLAGLAISLQNLVRPLQDRILYDPEKLRDFVAGKTMDPGIQKL